MFEEKLTPPPCPFRHISSQSSAPMKYDVINFNRFLSQHVVQFQSIYIMTYENYIRYQNCSLLIYVQERVELSSGFRNVSLSTRSVTNGKLAT